MQKPASNRIAARWAALAKRPCRVKRTVTRALTAFVRARAPHDPLRFAVAAEVCCALQLATRGLQLARPPDSERRRLMSGQIVVHRSHRLESLADVLAEFVGTPLTDPLAREWVVVQGRGMALWLNMQLAQRLGVWANANYVYPKRFVRQIFSRVLGQPADDDSRDRYQRDALTWAVHRALLEDRDDPSFASLSAYRGDDPDGTRVFSLSEQIAQCFDEYLTFRPALLAEWESASGVEGQLPLFGQAAQSSSEDWQSKLWKKLVARLGQGHIANLERAFTRSLRSKKSVESVPERIAVFGLSSLPPQYVRVLGSLAQVSDVQLFMLDPNTSPATRQRVADADAPAQDPIAVTGADGHPPRGLHEATTQLSRGLIDSCGALGAEFERILSRELKNPRTTLRSDYHPTTAAGGKLLHRLQRGLLSPVALQDASPSLSSQTAGDASAPKRLADDSIRVHACHSTIREVEVLHDQLLSLLDAGFAPDEILVMMPNVDDYAPLIEAVFKRSTDDPRFIPYRISDRKPQGGNPVLEGFLRVLMLADRRAAASEVLDLLTLQPVRERFGVEAEDLEQITRWVSDAGIRWGVDAGHKQREGVPADDRNTWQFGIDRLLLGYALDTRGEQLVAGILPYEHIEGKTGALLGRFVHFVHSLFSSIEMLERPRTVAAWQDELSRLLERLLARNVDNTWQHQHLLSVLAALRSSSQAAEFEQPVTLQVIRQWVQRHCDNNREAHGFLAGGVTFCAMVPMRSIPFRAICLLGMNDGDFPRATRRVDFNLLQAGTGRQAGDPDRRMDDRHLFLEALLSARERLLISYVGQSVRDNTKLAPSIVVSELIDELESRHGIEPDSLTIRHPLQPFSPRYFTDPDGELFSYQELYLSGASMLSQQPKPLRQLFPEHLPAPPAEDELPLSAMADFFGSPTEYLLKRRLNVQVRGEHLSVSDREPAELEALDDYQVGATALEQHLRGIAPEQVRTLTEATGQLPGWAPGERAFRRVMESVNPIAAAGKALRQGGQLEPHWARTVVDGVAICGELTDLFAVGRVALQYSRVKAKNLLQLWIHHLALCSAPDITVGKSSWLVGRPTKGTGAAHLRLLPVTEPEKHLSTLLSLYQLGQTQPLRLFPEASLTFTRFAQDPRSDRDKALWAATTAYRAELRFNDALAQVYGDADRLDFHGPEGSDPETHPNFEEVALRVFSPLLEHLEVLA